MRWSLQVARIAGIRVRIHLTFLLFLGWIAFAYYLIGGLLAAIEGLVFILALFACVLLHEFGHALAARAFGILTPDITLLPIGGLARLQRMPDRPWQEVVVAIAGPLVNVVIAATLILVLGHDTPFSYSEVFDQPRENLLVRLAVVNVALVVFNLIPAFPMDGGRVLRAVLALTMDYTRATQIAGGIGQVFAVALGIIGLLWNPLLILIAVFVYLGAQQEVTMTRMKALSREMTVTDAMITHVMTLPAHASITEAIELLLRTTQTEFPVLDDTGRGLGVLTRDHIFSALKRRDPTVAVVDVMHREPPLVRPDDSFEDAFRRLQESSSPAMLVVDDGGRLLGMITPEHVGDLMLVHSFRLRSGRDAPSVP